MERDVEEMVAKYKQQEQVNNDLMKQIELLEVGKVDMEGVAEEMKRIYQDRNSYHNSNSLSKSDKLPNKLGRSAMKMLQKSRRSNLMP